MTGHRIPARNETEAERLDRQLMEMLQEIRVAITGVQVLFAFLLTVPFAARWDDTSELQRNTYFVTLLCTALATTLLLFPSALHRLRFRRADKRRIVEWANRATIAGLGVLVLAMTGAVFMVTDILFEVTSAAIVAAVTFVLMTGLWFVLPLSRRVTRGKDEEQDEGRGSGG